LSQVAHQQPIGSDVARSEARNDLGQYCRGYLEVQKPTEKAKNMKVSGWMKKVHFADEFMTTP
jgi:hypothetical protein